MDTVHECDRQTDRRTDRIAITKTVQRRASHGKNRITTFCRVPHGEMTAKKWIDSIEKQKTIINLKFMTDKRTDIGADRQTESTVDNNDS